MLYDRLLRMYDIQKIRRDRDRFCFIVSLLFSSIIINTIGRVTPNGRHNGRYGWQERLKKFGELRDLHGSDDAVGLPIEERKTV